MGAVTVTPRDDSYTRKDGLTSLYCTLYIGRQRVRIPVGVKVKPANWDSETERVKGNSKEARDANLIINNVKSRVNDIFVNYRLNNRKLTKEIFIREYGTNSDYADFWEFMAPQPSKKFEGFCFLCLRWIGIKHPFRKHKAIQFLLIHGSKINDYFLLQNFFT